jgi:hypothetical protein
MNKPLRSVSLDRSPYDAGTEALDLADKWEKRGIIVTIERHPLKPLAMGNHSARVRTWRKRGLEHGATPERPDHIGNADEKVADHVVSAADYLRRALDWIDAIPEDVAAALPAMPGFDRDIAEAAIAAATEPRA